jgi:two-component system NtrC family sensor kinase
MKLRPKVIALLGGLFGALAASQFFTQEKILLPSFAALERQVATTDMERVRQALNREVDLVAMTAADWADWDETYRFMQSRDTAFIDENITLSAIQGLKVNAIAFVDVTGKFLWAKSIASGTGDPLALDLIERGALPPAAVWQEALRHHSAVRGLVSTNRGAMLVAGAPILDGHGRGPSRGMLIFGRLLTEDKLAAIGRQAQFTLAISALQKPGGEPPGFLPADAEKSGDEALMIRDDFTEVYRVLPDLTGAPLMTLRIQVPRSISERGREAVNYAVFFTVVAGVAVLLLMIVTLNSSVLKPLGQVTDRAVEIGQGNDLTLRLNLTRADEIGTLAQAFDRMLERLAAARRQLVDQSYEAGIAENAGGILHNLGNAMTPLGVNVAGLEKSLREAPTADVELVVAELDMETGDPRRKADLEDLLRLTSRELARIVSGAQHDIEAIARQAQTIREVLAQQAQYSNSSKLVETVLLPETVERSIELVPPTLRETLTIDIDPSLQQVGAVRLARTTLQQVFQNLVVNAAEAVRDAGRERGVLGISVAVVPSERGDQLQFCFADDGVGIAADNLGRIFEKGFSTKPASANSGIGLHWCANVVNELGGGMYAESAGSARGSKLFVMLPLERAQPARRQRAA